MKVISIILFTATAALAAPTKTDEDTAIPLACTSSTFCDSGMADVSDSSKCCSFIYLDDGKKLERAIHNESSFVDPINPALGQCKRSKRCMSGYIARRSHRCCIPIVEAQQVACEFDTSCPSGFANHRTRQCCPGFHHEEPENLDTVAHDDPDTVESSNSVTYNCSWSNRCGSGWIDNHVTKCCNPPGLPPVWPPVYPPAENTEDQAIATLEKGPDDMEPDEFEGKL